MIESDATGATSDDRAALRAVRQRLLILHKALLDHERARHERDHGPIESTQQHLQLLMEHESFAWLRPLSGLIVRIDERLAAREGVSSGEVRQLATEVRALTSFGDERTDYQHRYHGALESSAAILAAHADVARSLAPLLSPGRG